MRPSRLIGGSIVTVEPETTTAAEFTSIVAPIQPVAVFTRWMLPVPFFTAPSHVTLKFDLYPTPVASSGGVSDTAFGPSSSSTLIVAELAAYSTDVAVIVAVCVRSLSESFTAVIGKVTDD